MQGRLSGDRLTERVAGAVQREVGSRLSRTGKARLAHQRPADARCQRLPACILPPGSISAPDVVRAHPAPCDTVSHLWGLANLSYMV